MTPISFSLLLPVLLPASFSKFRPQKKMIDNLLYGILRSHASHAARSSSQDTEEIHGILPMRFARFSTYTVSRKFAQVMTPKQAIVGTEDQA
jgi:hypothetical protein